MKLKASLVDLLASGAFILAKLTIAAMAATIVADVLLRKLFRAPIPGAYEVVAFLGAFAVAFALPHIQRSRAHIVTEFVLAKLPQAVRRRLGFVTLLLEGVFFAVLAWQFVKGAFAMQAARQVSDILHVPLAGIYALVAAGFALVVLVILRQLTEVRAAG